jgi:hypothetical protein
MSALRFDDWDLPSAAAQPNATVAPKKQTKTEIEPVLPADGAPARAAYLAPINAADKRIVNGKADINQLAPFKYPWAWEFFLKANRNHWTPLEIGMAQDVHDYHHKLSAAERHVFENVLAYLTTSDILAMRNIGLAVMEKMSAPELQIYQARQSTRRRCTPGPTSTASKARPRPAGNLQPLPCRAGNPRQDRAGQPAAGKGTALRLRPAKTAPTCTNSRCPTSSSR